MTGPSRSVSTRRYVALLTMIAIVGLVIGLALQPASAAPVTVIDVHGPDDEPGQKDLNSLSVDVASTTADIVVTWTWDIISLGGGTADGCSVFDTDADGNADYVLCVSWEGNATYASTTVYECGDTSATNCTGSAPIVGEDLNADGDMTDAGEGNLASTCSMAVVTDVFGARPQAQADTTSDAQATCLIDLGDFAGSTATLINVCSYPSSEPTSDASDCVVTPAAGFLALVKNATPDDGTTFTFNLGAGQSAQTGDTSFSIDGSGSMEFIPFEAANYDLTEVVPAGFNLEAASCTRADGTATGTFSGTTITNFEIETGRTTTCTFTNSAANPGIEINKSGSLDLGPDDLATPGDLITYELVVTNVGNVTLTNVTVSDPLLTTIDCGDGTATIGTMAPSPAGVTCSGTYAITQADIDAGVRDNTADADGLDPNGNPVNDDDSHSEPIPQDPKLSILKESSPSTYSAVDAVITYSITATNTGNTTLNDVTVTDADVDGLTCVPANGATLAPGSSITCSGTHTINQSDLNAGSYANIACVNDGIDGAAAVCDDETVTADQNPSIEAIKVLADNADEDGSTDVSLGDTLFFSIVARNTGNVTLTDVTVDDDLTGTTDAPCASTLAPGATCEIVVPYVVTQADVDAGEVENTGTVEGNPPSGPPVTGSDPEEVPVPQNPAIDADKVLFANADEDGDGEVSLDDTLTYRITATNTGNVTLASVTVEDVLAGVVGAFCADSLAPGEDCFVDVTYVVTETDMASGQIDNLGQVQADPPTGPPVIDDDPETVPVDTIKPDIAVSKVVDVPGVPETGGTANFTFGVVNLSAEALTLDSLTDTVFGDLDGLGTCDLTTSPVVLAPVGQTGSEYNCDYSPTLAGDASAPDHVNTATWTASDNDGNSVTETDTQTIEFFDVLPDVSITKTADPTSVAEPGGDVEFTIVVTNNSIENVQLDSLTDSDFELEGRCDVQGTVLSTDGTYTCTFTEFVAGNFGDDHNNVATVVASDNEFNSLTVDDDADVVINDVAPVIEVTKIANQAEVFAPGEAVTFTVRVENNSVSTDPVTITSLVDDVFGDISAGCVLPQTIGSGGAFECDITRTISGDHTNTVTATAVDDEGNEVTDFDDASVEFVNPSLAIEKNTGPADADTPPGPEILVGETVNWFYQVTNDGDVDLENLAVTDDQGVTVDCAVDTLVAGATTVCQGSGTAVEGQYANIGTATASYTDADGDTANLSGSDPSHYFGAVPLVDIAKAFADDSVIAGGSGSSFTLVVTNDGNVDLANVSVNDVVDGRLEVTGVSATAGVDADSDADAQTVEWLIPSLAVGDSVTITVDFGVASDVAEADGVGGLNDAPAVLNTATVSDDYTDDVDNSTTVNDSASDTVDILVDINLSIVKAFDPDSVPQGTVQSFTIEVSNSGPSDAVDVSVTDLVDDTLDVQGAAVTDGSGDCSASSGQDVDCTVQIPAGESVTVTVDYVTAPFLTDDSPYGTLGGDDFRFVFVNGSVLEGSTDGGPVFLDGVDVTADVTIIEGLTRNDIVFDPPGPDPAFELHLSCSDPFTGGWGQSGGPIEGVDTNWQVAFFSIARYNNNGFIKSCGNVTNAFDVANSADAVGVDSFGDESVSDSDIVTVEPGITITRVQTNGRRLTVRLTNFTGDAKILEDVSIEWPASNGDLEKVRLDDPTVWEGGAAPTAVTLDATDSGWAGGTLATGESILRFDFDGRSANSGYVIRVNFTDGTFLDIAA